MTTTRAREESDTPNPTVAKSKAARFNLLVLKRLQAAVENDPEVDLTSKFPSGYSDRLSEKRSAAPDIQGSYVFSKASSIPEEDIRMFLQASDSATILFPLSELVRRLLADDHNSASLSGSSDPALSASLLRVMQRSEILWKSPFPHNKMVFKCHPNMVVKAVRKIEDYTEYTTLQYLERHKPSVPAPRPLGVIRMSGVSLIFMTYFAETTLEEVWTRLDAAQKASVQNQLDKILTDLRSLPRPDGMPFGGVEGEGCKDLRRHLRRSTKPIMSISDFEDFLFCGLHPGGHVFVELLRQLSPLCQLSVSESHKCVFTHGDLRPDNITVEITNHDQCLITGLLDWEYSGFYPEYYESIKGTNCLTPTEDNDWYLFLPQCISLNRYTTWWLLDRVRGWLLE